MFSRDRQHTSSDDGGLASLNNWVWLGHTLLNMVTDREPHPSQMGVFGIASSIRDFSDTQRLLETYRTLEQLHLRQVTFHNRFSRLMMSWPGCIWTIMKTDMAPRRPCRWIQGAVLRLVLGETVQRKRLHVLSHRVDGYSSVWNI